jgi:hypothetical protein
MNEADKEFHLKWAALLKRLGEQFGEDLDYDGIIFLIGIQELGKGKLKLKKDEKLEIMHVAVCKLMSQYNYYKFLGYDEDGWPHYEATEELPFLTSLQQHRMMKEAIINYFDEN